MKRSAKLLDLLSFDSILSDIHHTRSWMHERDTDARSKFNCMYHARGQFWYACARCILDKIGQKIKDPTICTAFHTRAYGLYSQRARQKLAHGRVGTRENNIARAREL